MIAKLEELESSHCDSCERPRGVVKESTYACQGCPVFAEIRAIGDELNNLSNQQRIDSAPEELTRTTYLDLRDRGWLQEEICKHYGIGHSSFRFFLISNGLAQQPDEGKKKKNVIKMTAEEYYEMQEAGLNDKEIAESIGVAPQSIMRWKRRKGVGSYADKEICSN